MNLSFDFNDGSNGLPKIIIGNFIKDFEFTGEAELILNGVLIGNDNEKRLYEQLREKFEIEPKESLLDSIRTVMNQTIKEYEDKITVKGTTEKEFVDNMVREHIINSFEKSETVHNQLK